MCGTLVFDSRVIADQWGQEAWLINGAYYSPNKSRPCQRMSWTKDYNCYLHFMSSLFVCFCFKESPGSGQSWQIISDKDQEQAFLPAVGGSPCCFFQGCLCFGFGKNPPNSWSMGCGELVLGPGQWHQGLGPQSLEYCPVVLKVGLARSLETEWALYQSGLGPWISSVLLSLGSRGLGQQELSCLGDSGRRDCFLLNEASE